MLLTSKRDGRPQASNIMFAVGDDGLVRISATDGRAKTANARRDGRVSLHVTAADFWSYVVIDPFFVHSAPELTFCARRTHHHRLLHRSSCTARQN